MENNKNRKILIAPWGNPKTWGYVEYQIEGSQDKISSKTSLKALCNKISPDKVLILVGDTLAEVEEIFNTVYENIETAVQEKIKKFLKTPEVGLEDQKNIEILVLPSVGKFPNGSFEGHLLDYYYMLFYKLAKIFLKNTYEEVYLDLTHGINFMPVLTYRSVRELLSIFAFFSKVKLFVYNADPFSGKEKKHLFLHLVEETEIEAEIPTIPKFYKNSFSPKLIDTLTKINEKESTFKIPQEFIREIIAFLGAVFFGLPLVIFNLFPNIEELKKYLELAVELWRKKIEINLEKDRIRVKRKVFFTPICQPLLLAWTFAEKLRQENLISERCKEVEIKQIEDLSKNFLFRNRRVKIFIGKELKDLKNVHAKEEWEIYKELIKKKSSQSPDRLSASSEKDASKLKNQPSPDSRNLLAHGGFEKNIVEISKRNSLKVKYKENFYSFIISTILKNF